MTSGSVLIQSESESVGTSRGPKLNLKADLIKDLTIYCKKTSRNFDQTVFVTFLSLNLNNFFLNTLLAAKYSWYRARPPNQ